MSPNHFSIIGINQLPKHCLEAFITHFPSSHKEKNVTFFHDCRKLDLYMFSETWLDVYTWNYLNQEWVPSPINLKEQAKFLISKYKMKDSSTMTVDYMINKLTTEQYDSLPNDIKLLILTRKLLETK